MLLLQRKPPGFAYQSLLNRQPPTCLACIVTLRIPLPELSLKNIPRRLLCDLCMRYRWRRARSYALGRLVVCRAGYYVSHAYYPATQRGACALFTKLRFRSGCKGYLLGDIFTLLYIICVPRLKLCSSAGTKTNMYKHMNTKCVVGL